MVYISRDGTVHNKAPWNVDRVWGAIIGFFSFIVMLFRTLVDPLMSIVQGSNSGYSGRGNGGSGGGGGSGGSDRRPPGGGPPRRPIGRINTQPSCNVPGGGCSGGSCGM